MIKLNTNRPTIRETTATFEQVDDKGNIAETPIRVLYYSFTTKRLKEIRAEVQRKLDAGETLWHSETLVDQLHGLPDLVDEKERPLFVPHGGDAKKREAAIDFLDSLEVKNVEAIRNAIDEAVRPKAPPEK